MNAVKGFFKEFEKFALRGNFMDLAVGIVIGAAFNSVVNSLVNDIITPPIGLLIGHVKFSDLSVPLGGSAAIQYGAFLQALISFTLTALALFLIVRLLNRLEELARRRRHNEATKPPVPADSPEVLILKEIRDLLKTDSHAA